MHPLFDQMHVANGLRNQVIPALERFAEHPALRDNALSRFDHDEPPPYLSSTEEGEVEPRYPATGPIDSAVFDEFKSLLEKPLNDERRTDAAHELNRSVYNPGWRYNKELEREGDRIRWWVRDHACQKTRKYFLDGRNFPVCSKRINIIARHNIKRRWQSLGVWNPKWGITQSRDDAWRWSWEWQQKDTAAEFHAGRDVISRSSQHPIIRALLLRQHLRRSERTHVPPHSHLQADASPSQAESFMMFRPWLMHEVESYEEWEKYNDIPRKMTLLYERLPGDHSTGKIEELWKEAGQWDENWRDDGGNTFIGWKWRHESPSPEPEDLFKLNDLDTFEVTPSEFDALEALSPPNPFQRESDHAASPPPTTQPLRRSSRIAANEAKKKKLQQQQQREQKGVGVKNEKAPKKTGQLKERRQKKSAIRYKSTRPRGRPKKD